MRSARRQSGAPISVLRRPSRDSLRREMVAKIGAGAMNVLAELFAGIVDITRDRSLGNLAVLLPYIAVPRRTDQEDAAISVVEILQK
jgi:hypothetical protein